MKQINNPPIGAALPELPIGDVTDLLTSPPDLPKIQDDQHIPVGVVDIETNPVPDDLPSLLGDDRSRNQQAPRGQITLALVGLLAIAAATVAYLISRGVDAFRSVSDVHWILGSAYLFAVTIAVACIALLFFRSIRRYQWLREITVLQELARQSDARQTLVSGPEVRNRIEEYLSQVMLGDDHKVKEQIRSLRRHYQDSPKDPRQDFQDLHDYLFQLLDGRVNEIIDRKASQVAWGTAFASHLFDPIIVMLQTVTMVDRIATTYGGRPGVMGTLRLLRRGMAAVAFAELAQQATELVTTLAMGKMASKLGSRAAEGVANGLMMIRFGDAVKSQCRPIPLPPSSISNQAARLVGLFGGFSNSKPADKSRGRL